MKISLLFGARYGRHFAPIHISRRAYEGQARRLPLYFAERHDAGIRNMPICALGHINLKRLLLIRILMYCRYARRTTGYAALA